MLWPLSVVLVANTNGRLAIPALAGLLVLYTAELADIAAQYEITLHAFADDNQLYVHCVEHSQVAEA